MDDETTDLLFGGGAGGGKSLFGCAWLIIMCGKYPGTRWLLGRSKLKNLKETTLQTFFDLCQEWGMKSDVDFKYDSNAGTITWTNSSVILLKDLFLYPSDPNFDSLGSLEITGAFVDEVNQITFKAWNIVRSRIRYKLDKFNLLPKLLGTCNPSKGWVYMEFYKPWRENKTDKSNKFVQALVTDNPFISKYYIENLKRIKDKATKERLLLGNWEYDDDPSCLFEYDVIVDLFTTKAEASDKKYITGDVSRKGRDKTVIQYWEGLQCKEITVLDYETKKDLEKTKKWIADYAEKMGVRRHHIILDEDGVGGGVVDMLGCVGFINNSSPLQPYEAKFTGNKLNYANLKTQCYFKLAQLAEQGKIGIDCGDTDIISLLTEELEQVKQKDVDKDGKVLLIGKEMIKENIGRSPDFADALMMRMYFELETKPEPSVSFI